jgi:hypothetical protein
MTETPWRGRWLNPRHVAFWEIAGGIAAVIALLITAVGLLLNHQPRHQSAVQLAWASNPYVIKTAGGELSSKYLRLQRITVDFQGGKVILSSHSDGPAVVWADDKIEIDFVGPHGEQDQFTDNFSNNCGGGINSGPGGVDITDHLLRGKNILSFVIRDDENCEAPHKVGSSDIYLFGNFKRLS